MSEASISATFVPYKSEGYTSDSHKSDSDSFNSILPFAGIGLLISLVAILTGVQGVWY
jgi:hypothetical protein